MALLPGTCTCQHVQLRGPQTGGGLQRPFGEPLAPSPAEETVLGLMGQWADSLEKAGAFHIQGVLLLRAREQTRPTAPVAFFGRHPAASVTSALPCPGSSPVTQQGTRARLSCDPPSLFRQRKHGRIGPRR